jgi:DNA-binding MarR family transcriptional regulator
MTVVARYAFYHAYKEERSLLERCINLAELLAHANYLMSESFCDLLKAHSISAVEWRVLNGLSADDGLKMTELAARMLFKLPTLTMVVDRMEEAQLVERRASIEDGRCAIARLTEHGRRVAAPLIAHASQHEAALQRMLGATASREIKEALAELIDRLRHLQREMPATRSRVSGSLQARTPQAQVVRGAVPAPSNARRRAASCSSPAGAVLLAGGTSARSARSCPTGARRNSSG